MSDKSIKQAFHDARDGVENEQDIPKGNDHTVARKDNVEFPIPPPRYTGFSRPDLAPRGMVGVRQEQNSRPPHKLEMSGAPPRNNPPSKVEHSPKKGWLTPIFNEEARKIGDKGKLRKEFARATQPPPEKRRKIGVHDKEEKLARTFNQASKHTLDRSR